MKDIDEAKYNAIVPIKEKIEDGYAGKQGITGIGIGYKQVNNVETEEMCIIFFVKKKGFYDLENEIPAQIETVRTDVVEMSFAPAMMLPDNESSNRRKYDPLQGGASGCNYNFGAGTLGVAVQNTNNDTFYMLSCYHVLKDEDSQTMETIQPSAEDGGKWSDVIGSYVNGYLGEHERGFGRWNYYLDCAICSVEGRPNPSSAIVGIGSLVGTKRATMNAPIKKSGRTTGLTTGKIVDTNFTIFDLHYESPINRYITFKYQYRIDTTMPYKQNFAEQGDSGSIVVDENGYAIGLLFAVAWVGNPNNIVHSYANPMYMITDYLNIKII